MITPMTTPMTTPNKDLSAATFQASETLQPSLDRNKVNPSGETPAAKLNHTPHGGTQDFEPGLGIPDDLAPGIRTAALRSGMRYESFVQQLVSCAFSHVKFWQHSDVERLFWLADRLGLDPLERDLIALEQRGHFPASVAFMITLDGWVKLLHRHPRFRGLSFEEGPIDEHGLPLWQSCSLYWEGFACPWVVREWASEHRSLHESWLNHPRRMLRHKALTQCARLALGVGGGFWPSDTDINSDDYQTPSIKPILSQSPSKSIHHSSTRGTTVAALKRGIGQYTQKPYNGTEDTKPPNQVQTPPQ